jgi:hypothetical protein
MKNIPGSYKKTFIIFFVAAIGLSAFLVLRSVTLPVTPPEEPAFSDYFVTILFLLLKILISAGICSLLFMLLQLFFQKNISIEN